VKRLKLAVTFIVLNNGLLFGAFTVGGTLRYGPVDTGRTTKEIVSPEIALWQTLDRPGVHAIGLSYLLFRWSDLSQKMTGRPRIPDYPYEVDLAGNAHWDVLFLDYKYAYPISQRAVFYISPRVGLGWAAGSGTETSYGGFTGISSVPYSFTTSGHLAAEAQAGAVWRMNERWSSHLGVSATTIRGETLPLMGRLRSLQASGGIGFSF